MTKSFFKPWFNLIIPCSLIITLTIIILNFPLFNVPGYEFAALFSIILALISGFRTLWVLSSSFKNYNYSFVFTILNADSRMPFNESFPGILVFNFFIYLIPFTLLIFKSAFSSFCSLETGLFFYLLLPGITTFLTTSSACLAFSITPSFIKSSVLFFLIIIFSAIISLLNIIYHPPIFTYNIFLGYFPGPIYDEYIPINSTLIVARFGAFNMGILFIICAHLIFQIRSIGFIEGIRRSKKQVCILAFSFILMIFLEYNRESYGIRPTGSFIIKEMGGKYETEHFILYYDDFPEISKEIRNIAMDHEFRYFELRNFFGWDMQEKIHSFIYSSPEHKKKLMGAGETSLEDPVTKEIHINFSPFPHPLLKHELAHIFSTQMGIPFLGISLRVGLLEGIAVAADETSGDYTLHEWSSALYHLGYAPDIEKILGPIGFWSQAAPKAYTLSGSFVMYLIENYGMYNFARAYPLGDFDKAYGKNIEALKKEWEDYLETVPMDTLLLSQTRSRYYYKGIFSSTCAHEVSRLINEAQKAFFEKKNKIAEKNFYRVLEFEPENPTANTEILRLNIMKHNYDFAKHTAQNILSNSNFPQFMHDFAKLKLGDIFWFSDKPEDARLNYENLTSSTFSLSFMRDANIKHNILEQNTELNSLLRKFFLTDDNTLKLYYLKQSHEKDPDYWVPCYLLGRQLYSLKAYSEAIKYLKKSLYLNIPYQEVLLETIQLTGIAYFLNEQYIEAEEYFKKLLENSTRQGQKLLAKDWIRRCEWARVNLAKFK